LIIKYLIVGRIKKCQFLHETSYSALNHLTVFGLRHA
jgi:hypothetical protein